MTALVSELSNRANQYGSPVANVGAPSGNVGSPPVDSPPGSGRARQVPSGSPDSPLSSDFRPLNLRPFSSGDIFGSSGSLAIGSSGALTPDSIAGLQSGRSSILRLDSFANIHRSPSGDFYPGMRGGSPPATQREQSPDTGQGSLGSSPPNPLGVRPQGTSPPGTQRINPPSQQGFDPLGLSNNPTS